MKIVVIGDGKVGRSIIEHVSKEGHEIIVIDKNPNVVEQLVNAYDVMGVVGNGASYEIQKSARVEKADLLIATTPSDEINILSCIVSKMLGVKATVARVRSYDYSNQTNLMVKNLGINMIINPEMMTADEIMNVINFPEAISIESFAKGNVEMIEIYVSEQSPLVGAKLASFYDKFQVQILVCAIQRGEEVVIPDGNFVIMPKDKIHLTATKANLKLFLQKIGLAETKIKDALIIGGGKISLYLAKKLLKNKFKVKIIEKDLQRCIELNELLPSATIIHGDGSDQELLMEEGINAYNAVIPLTNSDEENIIISLFASKQKAKKIITKINRHSFIGLIETIGMSSVVSPKELTAQQIVSYIRAKSNSRGSNIRTLYKIVNNEVEALEFVAKKTSKVVNKPLKDLILKKNVLIAAIIREDEVIIPKGNDAIQENDSVIVITKDHLLDELNDILV